MVKIHGPINSILHVWKPPLKYPGYAPDLPESNKISDAIYTSTIQFPFSTEAMAFIAIC